MKTFIQIFFISTLFFSTFICKAQDVHFSQFYNMPLLINPAMTGDFNAKARFIMNYKNQWRSVSANPYNTIAFTADGILKKKKFGVGLIFISDNSGSARIRSNQIYLSASAKAHVDKNNYVTYGLQAGWAQHSNDLSKLTWNSQYDGQIINPTLESGEDFYRSFNYFDISNGLHWKHLFEDKTESNIGVSAYHVTRPEFGFSSSSKQLNIRWCYYANTSLIITENTQLYPSILIMNQANVFEINVGLYYKRKLGLMSRYTGMYKPSYISLGAYCRINDAIIPFIKYDYNNQYAFGLSYDVNISKFHTATQKKGSTEFSILYILK